MALIPGHCPNCGVNLAVIGRVVDRKDFCSILHEHLGLIELQARVMRDEHPDVQMVECESRWQVWPRERDGQRYPTEKDRIGRDVFVSPKLAVEAVLDEIPEVAWPWK